MITGAQVKAVRTLLGWSLFDFARRAAIEIADAQEVENSAKLPKRRIRDAEAIQQALEVGGIEFIDFVGVRLLLR